MDKLDLEILEEDWIEEREYLIHKTIPNLIIDSENGTAVWAIVTEVSLKSIFKEFCGRMS